MELTNKENVRKILVHAEVSLIPIGSRIPSAPDDQEETGMSREIAVAFDAISKVEGLKTILTPMGTQIESENLSNSMYDAFNLLNFLNLVILSTAPAASLILFVIFVNLNYPPTPFILLASLRVWKP